MQPRDANPPRGLIHASMPACRLAPREIRADRKDRRSKRSTLSRAYPHRLSPLRTPSARPSRRHNKDRQLMNMQSLLCDPVSKASFSGQRTILHIEDDACDAILLRSLIESSDWPDPASRPTSILNAPSLENALDMLEREPVDAVILDLGLRDRSGLDSCRRLLDQVPQVPVIVLTGQNDPALGLAAVRLGAQDFLTKDEVNSLGLWRALTFGRERHRILDELASALHDKQAAQWRAEREAKSALAASRAKEDFLALMSHEFRTPLNGIIGLSSVLSERAGDASIRSAAATIRQSGNRVLSLVSDIVDVVASGSLPVDLEAVSFNPAGLVTRVVADLHAQAKTKGIDLRFSPGLRPMPELQGDASRLGRLFSHLLAEAVHASRPGPLNAALRLDPAVLSAGPGEVLRRHGEDEERAALSERGTSARVLRFEVHHTGSALDEAVRERLMAPVNPGDGTLCGPRDGGSLSLALARGLCAVLGGRIGVEPWGYGTRLWVCVPVDLAPEAHGDGRPTGRSTAPKGRGTDARRILIVEDTPVNRMVFKAILDETDHRIDFAHDGLSAVALAKSNVYDLILMDIQLPDIDGIETTRKIRKLPDGHGAAPIVAVTAFGVPGDRGRFLGAGMDDYLTKPVTPATLLSAINRFLTPSTCTIPKPDDPSGAAGAITDP